MESSFRRGAREGMRDFLPLSVGLVPWAVVTGIAMRSIGLSPLEAMGMNLLVYAGTAQLGTLPLIGSGAPLWLIFLTALVLNLRFVIFSAALAPVFHGHPFMRRLASSYLLVDGMFAIGAEKLHKADDPHWRWGYYIVPSLYCWALWQCCVLGGVLGAGVIPRDWSLEFMTTIALMVMMIPMLRARPMWVAALVGGLGAVLLRELPLRLGLIAGIALGIGAGFVAERALAGRAVR
ncbi:MULTISPECIES: AzlC family ABC transporter permease [unclassified Thauera]|uniref:AzlC family ABC transporter permease n=1 Tax=unclassified Thauera TaxID=2609274 RepID=UPI0002CE78CF|nr:MULTISPECIES: AzlC family ABC transporter permease [unclassified Thauera]ENO92315.1 AzlC family protein [Thauera sp. 28]WBL63564.1 AzlC family ABC transporter permease [Thauera sp. WB-2]HAG76716.1 AzlC family protein [Thauera sp.]HAY11248.1 AzlC family protein [Thauera sp.]HRJ22822.1 AzlC family ABC transporter permease [Thauera sp.]